MAKRELVVDRLDASESFDVRIGGRSRVSSSRSFGGRSAFTSSICIWN